MRRDGSISILSCACLSTPVGPVRIAISPRGVLKISLRTKTQRGFIEALRRDPRAHAFEIRRDRASCAVLRRELEGYFNGRRRSFSASIDLRGMTPFQRRVLRATARVPFGEVASYSQIARTIGRPGAARAVGNALGANPVPILIPCHRIVASSGGIGGFTGGTALKRRLLRVEGIRV